MTKYLISLLFLVGCAGGEATPSNDVVTTATASTPAPAYGAHVTVRIDSSMDAYSEYILDAAKIWEPLGGFLIIDDQAPRSITCGSSTDPMFAANGGEALAYESASGITVDCGIIEIGLSIEEEEHEGDGTAQPVGTGASDLLAHEMGHLYGLPHEFSDPAGLMYPTGCCGRPLHLTDADVNDWYSVHPNPPEGP